jgi:outer membrane lipopolysaccharide assembly protein LptE/RlpB
MKTMLLACAAAAAFFASGCYSFTGASVPAHLKTIAIPLVDDQSNLGEPGLREQLTRDLTTLFLNDNTLQVADRTTADALLEGVIVTVADAPSVVQQGEQVSKRRITMTVRFTLQDMKKRRALWERTFSQWGDYDSGSGLSQRQTGLQEAMRKITEDVLLETVSGW